MSSMETNMARPVQVQECAVTLSGEHLHFDSHHGAVTLHLEPNQIEQLSRELSDLGNARVQTATSRGGLNVDFPPNYGDSARTAGGYPGALQAHPVSIRLNGRTLIIESPEGFINLQLSDSQSNQAKGELPDLNPET